MNRKKPRIIVLSVCGGVLVILGLIIGSIHVFLTFDDGYCPMESFGNITIVTTDNEGRVDDTDENTLVHNVLCWEKYGGDLIYIIDTENSKITVNILTGNVEYFAVDDKRISGYHERLFSSLKLHHNYQYLYED